MERHSFSQALWYVEQVIVPVRKEVNIGMPEKGDAIFIICPVDQHPAPDHNRQDGKIYPVCPSHYQRMFFFNDFHLVGILFNHFISILAVIIKPVINANFKVDLFILLILLLYSFSTIQHFQLNLGDVFASIHHLML